jgi:hypothetical protein
MTVKTHTPPKTSKSKSSSNSKKSDAPWGVGPDGKRARTSKSLPYENRMREFLYGVAGMAELGDEFLATAIQGKTDELAYGWAKLAQENPQVKRVLGMIFEGSAYAEALIPTISLTLMVGWHYGMVPDRLGVPVVMANGMMPVSREVESQLKQEAKKQTEAAAEATFNRERRENQSADSES